MYNAYDVAAQLNTEIGDLLAEYPDMFDSMRAEVADEATNVVLLVERNTRIYRFQMLPSQAVNLDLRVFCLQARKAFYLREVN